MSYVAEKMAVDQYSFRLTGLGSDLTGVVSGTMLNQLSLAGSNQYSTTGEIVRSGEGGIAGFKEDGFSKAKDFYRNKLVGNQIGGYGKFNKGETRAKWTESSKPQIQCEFILLANTAADAATNLNIIQLIKSASMPINDGGALKSPLGYKGTTKGTLTFALGTWFLATKLVMMSENCSPSMQVMSNGYPLSWNCQFSVEPYETVTVDDFAKWFQQPAILGSIGAPTAKTDSSLTGQLNNIKNSLNLKQFGVG